MKLKQFLAIGAAAILGLGVAGCGSSANEATDTPTGAAESSESPAESTSPEVETSEEEAADADPTESEPSEAEPADDTPITMKVAVASKLAGHWALWSGIQQGMFDNAGINVEVVVVQTDSAGVQALQSGSVDFIIGTVPQIVHANDAGADLIGVAAVQNRPIYRMIASKGITDAEQLRGESVGVSEVQLGIDSYLMQAWLEKKGLTTDDYTLVGTGGVSTRVAALSSGGVSLVAIPPPGDTPVIEEGYADLGFATETIEHMQWTLLVASRPQIESKESDFKRFLAVYSDAAKFVTDPVNEDAAKADLMEETTATPEAADASYLLMVGDRGISFDGFPDTDGIVAWEPLLDTDDLMEKVFDASYLPGT